MADYLRHITTTTGHSRDSLRDEISPEALAACRELLALVIADRPAIIPYTDLLIEPGPCTRKCAWLTVVTADLIPVCQVVIATHSRCGASAWRVLHAVGDPAVIDGLATRGQRCPPEPWVAARLEPGATLLDPDTLMLLGDLERCLGWAWLDMVSERRTAHVSDA